MTTFDRIACLPIAALKSFVSQMRFETDTSWHALVLQRHDATRYKRYKMDTILKGDVIDAGRANVVAYARKARTR